MCRWLAFWYDAEPVLTIATSDGEHLWAFRYSSEGRSRSLFFSRDLPGAPVTVTG